MAVMVAVIRVGAAMAVDAVLCRIDVVGVGGVGVGGVGAGGSGVTTATGSGAAMAASGASATIAPASAVAAIPASSSGAGRMPGSVVGAAVATVGGVLVAGAGVDDGADVATGAGGCGTGGAVTRPARNAAVTAPPTNKSTTTLRTSLPREGAGATSSGIVLACTGCTALSVGASGDVREGSAFAWSAIDVGPVGATTGASGGSGVPPLDASSALHDGS